MMPAQSLIFCSKVSSGVTGDQKPFGEGFPQRTPGPWPGWGGEAPPVLDTAAPICRIGPAASAI